MKKVSIGIVVLLSFFIMFGEIKAAAVSELIEKQNPLKLSKSDKANAKCYYTYSTSNDCTKDISKDYRYAFTAPFFDPRVKIENSQLVVYSKAGIATTNLSTFSSDVNYSVGLPSESLFLKDNVWYCPETIYANHSSEKRRTCGDMGYDERCSEKTIVHWTFSTTSSSSQCKLSLVDPDNVVFSGKKNNGENTDDYYASLDKSKNWACGGFVSDRLLAEINKIYKTLSLGIVAIVIILGVLDFLKAVSSEDDSALKKAGGKFMKRILIAMIIVMLPIILQFLLTIFGDSHMKECLDKIK